MKLMSSSCALFVIAVAFSSCREKAVNSNVVENALNKFPGFNTQQMARLQWAKEQNCIPPSFDSVEKTALKKATKGKCAIPLPTWIPHGFVVEKVNINLGKDVVEDSMQVCIVYNRKMANGTKQVFSIEAGFEFGDIAYEANFTVNTSIGKIYLYYEPTQEGQKLKGYVLTDWFGSDSVGYPKYEYNSTAEFIAPQYIGSKDSFEMISLEETKKILASMQKL